MPRLIPDSGPQRVLAASNFAYTVGSGLYLTAGVLYFTEAVRLPADQVGLGLGIAGLVALALGVAVGHLADRCGARGVYVATLLIQALATAGFVRADSFWPFVLVVCVAAAANYGRGGRRSPLIRNYGELQVRASRDIDSPEAGGRTGERGWPFSSPARSSRCPPAYRPGSPRPCSSPGS
ncbi:hypothetical protein ACGFXB_12260 [Streptomyces canus]|uniref:hypothetical protein n=1 Tax=Streptomyces canus TaxID=58343 RepID=UPI003717A5A7